MSTALGRPKGPDAGIQHLIIFIVLSVIIHLGVVFGLFSYAPWAERLKSLISPKQSGPVAVDVVELPPLPPGARPKTGFRKPPAHFADRAQSAEKETYPEAPKEGPLRPASPGGSIRPRVSGVRTPEGPAASPAQKGGPSKEGGPTGKNAGIAGASKAGDIPIKGITGAGQPNSATQGKGAGAEAGQKKPNLFLSNDQIAALERRYEAESPRGEKGKTLQLNTSELKYQKYLLAMKDAIERRWEYPSIAAANGWQGVLRINFTISKDGTVKDVQVVKSSNYPVLDDAAVTALKLAAPFPPFPESFSIEEINIKGAFEYDIIPSEVRGRN